MSKRINHIVQAERLLEEAKQHFAESQKLGAPGVGFDLQWQAMNSKISFVQAHIQIALVRIETER